MLYTNILNAKEKFLKYKHLNISPVLFAAVVLIPWSKWLYFEHYITLSESAKTKALVQELWDRKYPEKPIVVASTSGGSRGSAVAEKGGRNKSQFYRLAEAVYNWQLIEKVRLGSGQSTFKAPRPQSWLSRI